MKIGGVIHILKQKKEAPMFFFEGELTEEKKRLIDFHRDDSGSFIQVKNVWIELMNIDKVINGIMGENLTPKYIHVYPGENTVTIYIKEKMDFIVIDMAEP